MDDVTEVLQPLPTDRIRVRSGDEHKQLEFFHHDEAESHFALRLTESEAQRLAAELESERGIVHWFWLENGQGLRVRRNGEVRQVILFEVKSGKEVMLNLGVVLDEVVKTLADALKS